MTTTFTVTAEDITVPRQSNGGCCAIAYAAKRALGERFVWTMFHSLVFDGYATADGDIIRGHKVRFPEHVLDWHKAFVSGRPVEPITFTLDIPDLEDNTPLCDLGPYATL